MWPLPGQDGGRGGLTGVFSPAVRFLVRGKRVLYDLWNAVHTLVGDGHKEGRRSMVDGEEWRRPWRRVLVPGEGAANVERSSAHEHRGVMGMRFRYLFQPEVEWKGVVTVEVAQVSPTAKAARDSPDSDQGKDKARLGWVEGQAGVVRKL
jgi:hypothetical protein